MITLSLLKSVRTSLNLSILQKFTHLQGQPDKPNYFYFERAEPTLEKILRSPVYVRNTTRNITILTYLLL